MRSLHVVVVAWAMLTGLAVEAQEYRSIDGFGNNVVQPTWGSTDIPLRRTGAADYADGVSTPAGDSRPSAREISNVLCSQSGLLMNGLRASDFLWQWGQFVDHDIDLTNTGDEAFPILVPLGDSWFDPFDTGIETMDFHRSVFELGSSPREQLNAITAFIDASNVYGSDLARADALRTLDGTGKLRTSAGDLLPFNDLGFDNAQPAGFDPGLFFLAGDVRANEQVGLTALHTLFVREHNRLCDEIVLAQPGLPGEDIYLQARRIVGAELQAITYQEFLPLLVGDVIPPYTGYDAAVDPSIANEFSTAAYRVGHTMLAATLLRYTEQGVRTVEGHLSLADAFFAPQRITDEGGIDPILRGLTSKSAQEVDQLVVDEIRNMLFGPPGAGGLDLASLNIQRGRDHGLPDYNSLRVAYGLPARVSFDEINPVAAPALASLYGSVDDIDPWIGALVEEHAPGAMVGELAQAIIADQFTRLRDGDRFWYQIDLEPDLLADVEATRLADVIRRNTGAQSIADNAFMTRTFVRGDCQANGALDIADVITSLEYLFNDGAGVGCEKACDTNDDGDYNLGDAIALLSFLFGGGSMPGPSTCDFDDSDDMVGCYRYECL